MMHLFKGIRDTFENFEWNFRDIGIQRLMDFGDTCSKCYMILGILFQIFSGIWDIGDSPSRASAKDPNFLHADSENSDLTGRMTRLIGVFAGRTCHFVGFVMRRLKFFFIFGSFLSFNEFWKLISTEPKHDNKITCVPCEDSHQPGHSPSLISLRSAVRMKKHWVLSYP